MILDRSFALLCGSAVLLALAGTWALSASAGAQDDEPAPEPPAAPATAKSGEVRLELRDGQIVSGFIYDTHGAQLEVRRKLGTANIAKSAVVRWAIDEDPDGPRPLPMIILKSGHQVSGKIEFSTERGEWLVAVRSGTGRYPPDQVLRVVYPDGQCNDGAFTPRPGVTAALEQAISHATSGTPAQKAEALTALDRFGFFAVTSLEKAIKGGADPDGMFRQLLAKEKLRVMLPPEVEQQNPQFLATIMTGAAEARVELLRQTLLDQGAELFPFLAQLLLDQTQEPEVRGYAIEVLQGMRRVSDLVRAFEMARGQSQLALAVALGDIGIYIGIPTLIEALQLENREARALAARKLEEYTGESFGYKADAVGEEQMTAIARWQGWYRDQRERIEASLAYAMRPEEENPLRVKAATLWREGLAAWEARDLVLAETLFHKAIEQDPTALGAYVSLGTLCYREKGEIGAAKEMFGRALARASGERDAPLARLAYYHLGKIYERDLEYERARQSFRKAVEIDPAFAEGWYDLGEVTFQDATRLENVTVDERRARLGEAGKSFEGGYDAVVSYRRGLVLLERDEAPFLPGTAVSRRERNVTLRDLRQRMSAWEALFAHRAAQVRLMLGEKEKALEWSDLSIKAPTPRADYFLMRAQVLSALGRGE